MAAYVCKSKNVESSLDVNNIFSNKYTVGMFDLTKLLIAMVLTYFLNIWSTAVEYTYSLNL